MRRLLLIAGREFSAYVATLTFWIAVAVGPLVMLGAAALLSQPSPPPQPLSVAVTGVPAHLRDDAAGALQAAARALGRPLRIDESAPLRLTIDGNDGALRATFQGPILPEPARAVFAADLERRLALHLAARAGAPADALAARLTVGQALPPPNPAHTAAFARFGLVFILWLTLAGSLGMLLQAVARERANRALDILLAAARPAEIVFGKLVGVGAVSLLVLGAWMGSAAALALATGAARGALPGSLAVLANPVLLAQALATYALAYAAYGSATIALGAAAGDVASAQNLSRPMFAVLLLAFFAALGQAMGAGGALSWMIWLPPVTPFLWLLTPPEALSPIARLALPAIMALSALLACWVSKDALRAGRGGMGR